MESTELEEQIAPLASLADPTRRRLYLFAVARPQGVGRDEAATGVGISRALAAFHLDRLVADGLLVADYRRLSGRTGAWSSATAPSDPCRVSTTISYAVRTSRSCRVWSPASGPKASKQCSSGNRTGVASPSAGCRKRQQPARSSPMPLAGATQGKCWEGPGRARDE